MGIDNRGDQHGNLVVTGRTVLLDDGSHVYSSRNVNTVQCLVLSQNSQALRKDAINFGTVVFACARGIYMDANMCT